MPRNKSLLYVGLLASVVSACDRYIDRRDEITFGSGDSIAANKAAQIIDPWPVAARTIQHGMSGEQAVGALERMRKASDKGSSSEKSGGATPIGAPAPAGAPK
jgi:hypothetical protein